jgi:alpha-glucosidase
MRFRLFLLIVCLCVAPEAAARQESVSSPGAVLEFTLSDERGRPRYAVSRLGEPVIELSRLGMVFKSAPALTGGLAITSVMYGEADQTWTQPWGEVAEVRDRHRQMLVSYRAPDGRGFDVEVRLYDDGLGFRYLLAADEHYPERVIIDERTEFVFTDPGTVWWIPAREPERYEYLYHETAIEEVSLAHTPMTIRTKDGLHISIHEAALVDYAGMWLRRTVGRRFKADLTPWSDGTLVKTRGAITTPWRTLQITDTAGDLIESNLILNLNEPNKLGEVEWVEPDKYVGIWWEMHINTATWGSGPKHGATTERTKRYIDFAARHGFGGVLVEGWNTGWDGNWYQNGELFDFTVAHDDFDIEQLAAYAQERGVRLIGHHETGGAVSNYERQLDASLDFYEQLGVRVIKTGYVANSGEILRESEDGVRTREWHDGQWMVRHFQRVLDRAAERKISILTHEPVKDTGLRRTYPNWVAREGARGQEFNAWGEPGNPPSHTAILPFTRMLAGPMDFTPGIFDLLFEQEMPNNRVQTTLAKQLALYVVLFSPMQMAADLPENYEARPKPFQFIKDVPTDWSDTRVLAAEVGDFIAIARKDRGSDDWYLGALTDEKGRMLEVSLDFLENEGTYVAQIYRDGPDAHWRTAPYDLVIEEKEVVARDRFPLRMAPGGGIAVRFMPVQPK